MGERTSVTATNSVPIIAGWECSKCKTANVSEGSIRISYTETVSGGVRSRNVQETKGKVSQRVEESWKPLIGDMIAFPFEHLQDLPQFLSLKQNTCRKCGNQELWVYDPWWKLPIVWGVVLIATLLSVIMLFEDPKEITFWVVIAVAIAFVIYYKIESKRFPIRLKKLPLESTPAIVCYNEELNEYWSRTHRFPPNLYNHAEKIQRWLSESAEEQAGSNQSNASIPQTTNATNTEILNKNNEANASDAVFCYKCGKRLKEGSSFCSYCGTKL